MFDIYFEDGDPVAYDDEGWLGMQGTTLLGDLRETFIAPLGWWSRSTYQRQWLDGATRLLEGQSRSAFVLAPARLWWTAWLDDETVRLQQQLLVSSEIAEAWARSPSPVPYELVSERREFSSDGDPISEWQVTVPDLREFIARRG